MPPFVPDRGSTTPQKLAYILSLITDLGLVSPLHIFELQLRDAHERGRRTNRYRILKQYLDGDQFIDNLASILTHPLIPPNALRGGARGATLLDEVFIPMVTVELGSEVAELSSSLKMKMATMTHSDLLSLDFISLEA